MSIKISSLPNLETPVDSTILMVTDFQSTTGSFKITAANLKSYVITPLSNYSISAYTTANNASNTANAAYTTANNASNNIIILQNVNTEQNTRLLNIETVNTQQNTEISILQSVNLTQNTAISILQSVNLTQNTNTQIANTTANFANSAAATALLNASVADQKAVNAQSTANQAVIISQSANLVSSVALVGATTALNTATTASINAQNAYNAANIAFSLSANNETKLESAYSLANTTSQTLGIVQAKVNTDKTVSILEYGAIGDGVAVDTIAIQTAINSVNSGIVIIPPGYYLCDNIALKSGVTIKGYGTNTTILLANTDNVIMFKNETGDRNFFDIHDLSIKSNGNANCGGINISGSNNEIKCSRINIKNIDITGTANSIQLNYCKNYTIENNFFSENNCDIVLNNSNKGKVLFNTSESNTITYSINESTGSNNNIIMGNITKGQINVTGTGTLKINNIENIT